MSKNTFMATATAGAALAAAGLAKVINTGEFQPWTNRLLGRNQPTPEPKVSRKHLHALYQEVESIFLEHLNSAREVGASVAVFSQGELVVELYGGFMNREELREFDDHTLQLVYSCSKFMEAVAVARLVEQGSLDYNELVKNYWPEFSQGKKDQVKLCDVMRHEGGVPFFSDPQPTFDELRNFEAMGRRIASQPHTTNGKKVRCYHAINRGWLLNQIISRVDGQHRTLRSIYQQEFNKPLGIEFYLGLQGDGELERRRSKMYQYPALDSLMVLYMPEWIMGDKAVKELNTKCLGNGQPLRNAMKLKLGPESDEENGDSISELEIPSTNGFTNCLSLATVGNELAGISSGRQTSKFISKSALDQALADPIEEFDTSLHIPTTMTQGGFGVFTLPELGGLDTKFYGWSGMGGSIVLFNPEHDFSFAYVMNAMNLNILNSGRGRKLLVAAFLAHLLHRAN